MKRLLTLIAVFAVFGCARALAQEYVPVPVAISQEKVKLNGKLYLSHVVLEKQTLYSISKAYGVSEEDLYEANPSLRETGLQKNAILLIPIKDAAPQPDEQPSSQQEHIEHSVHWYEDIEDIARQYNVSVQEIMECNGLKSRKLSTRQKLRIPVKKEVKPAVPDTEETPEETTLPDISVTEVPADTLHSLPEIPEYVPTVEDRELLRMRSRDAAVFSLILPLRAGSGTSEMNMDFSMGISNENPLMPTRRGVPANTVPLTSVVDPVPDRSLTMT